MLFCTHRPERSPDPLATLNLATRHSEVKMLGNLQAQTWSKGLQLGKFEEHNCANEAQVRNLLSLAKDYSKPRQLLHATLRRTGD